MALNTAPSFMSPSARNTQQIAASPLAQRIAKPRAPAMDMMRRSGPSSNMYGPTRRVAQGGGGMGGGVPVMRDPTTGAMRINSNAAPPMGGMGKQRMQAPPLMDSGMVMNNAPDMGMGGFKPPAPSGGGYDGSGINPGPPGVFSEAYGSAPAPMEIGGGMRGRMSDPRFRY